MDEFKATSRPVNEKNTSIPAATVKSLRERTGAGMMDCKQALIEANGDPEKAIDIMRVSGVAKAAKRAHRETTEGVVDVRVNETGNKVVLAEINCETDFVARNEVFLSFIDTVFTQALTSGLTEAKALLTETTTSGGTLASQKEAIIAQLGENVEISRIKTIEASAGQYLGAYQHSNARIAVATLMEGGSSELAKDIAMHIAATDPECIAVEDLPKELLERERSIFEQEAASSGKPKEIVEKIIAGKMQKFSQERALLGQSFIKEPEQNIGELIKRSDATIKAFFRFAIGGQ